MMKEIQACTLVKRNEEQVLPAAAVLIHPQRRKLPQPARLQHARRCRSPTSFFDQEGKFAPRKRRRRAALTSSKRMLALASMACCCCCLVVLQRGVTPVDGLATRPSSSSSRKQPKRNGRGSNNKNKPPAAAALSSVDQETNDNMSLLLSQQQDPSSSFSKPRPPSAPTGGSQQQQQQQQQQHEFSFETIRDQLVVNNSLSASERDTLLVDCMVASSKDQWSEVLQWIQNEDGGIVSKATYDACLQACFEHSFATRAVDLLSAMRRVVEPDANDYALCILALCRKDVRHDHHPTSTSKNGAPSSLWRKALALQQEFVDNNKDKDVADLPVTTHDAMLACMVQDKAWKEAVRLLRFMEQPQPNISHHHNKTQPALSTYRTVIECCVAAKQAEPAVQVLQSCIATSNLTPTTYSFELVIAALCRIRQWRRARHLLDQMEALDVPRNVPIYHALLQACSRAREVAAAKQLLLRLERREPQLVPTTVSYNAVLAACAATSHWRDALQLLDQLHRTPGLEPDVYSYTNAIRACAKGGKTARALSLFQVVKDKKMPLDSYLYTAVIEACTWQLSLEFLAEMERNSIEPSEVTYSVVIKACGVGGQWQKALELLDEMRRKKMPINLYVYNAAITAVAKAAKQQAKLSSNRGDEDKSGNGGKLWIEVMTLLDNMRKDGIEPDGFSFSSAISCCGSEGRWEEALQLMDIMEKGGPRTRPNRIAYTAAISSCGRAGQVDHALRLFRQMKEQGLSADRVAFNALFYALRVAKRSDAAYELWDEMLGRHQTTARRPNKIAFARSDSTNPDIITLTDAIAAISSGKDDQEHSGKVDEVFAEAVRRGIILREDAMDTCWEYDLSGMSLPVARAAVRFLMKRLATTYGSITDLKGLTFITGVGRSGKNVGYGTTSLRDYVQDILLKEFHPGLSSTVPKLAQGTVEVAKETMANWIRHQKY